MIIEHFKKYRTQRFQIFYATNCTYILANICHFLSFHQSHWEFPFWRWQDPGPLLEKFRKFPLINNDLFTSKHVCYCQKVGETDSFLSTAQNSIVIAFKFTFLVTFIAGTPRIPVLKVTYFLSAFGKVPKIPVLELVATCNKIQ